MSQMATTGQMSPRVYSDILTTGTRRDALVTLPDRSAEHRHSLWSKLIDELLRWHHDAAELFDPDDVPTSQVLQTAMDFVQDSIAMDQPVPASVAPSGAGCISFEWRDDPTVITIEVLGRGLAEFTEFHRGRVIRQLTMERDPLTRKMQLRG